VTIPFRTAVLGGQHQIQLVRGSGKTESISLKIPAGIADGKTLRLRGQGERTPDGRPGDLLVKVRVAPHPVFFRRGNNLHLVLPIALAEAIQGAKVELPTPHGVVSVTVPPGSSSGRHLRLKGMGIRPPGEPAGDLIAELQLVLPEQPSADQTAALRQLAEQIGPYNPRKKIQW
jgi:DnaJ-class molecular chaperone